jgi:hypothetical protein
MVSHTLKPDNIMSGPFASTVETEHSRRRQFMPPFL